VWLQEAAEVLKTRDYVHLRPRQRVLLLRTLVDLALHARDLRDAQHVQQHFLSEGGTPGGPDNMDADRWGRWVEENR
jgi:hypothetical protein